MQAEERYGAGGFQCALRSLIFGERVTHFYGQTLGMERIDPIPKLVPMMPLYPDNNRHLIMVPLARLDTRIAVLAARIHVVYFFPWDFVTNYCERSEQIIG